MTAKPFRILIAPLNWGLGHATRCLPIAAAFAKTGPTLDRNVEIHWASDGQALALLKAELPLGSIIHQLPSYGIRYPTSSASVNMVLGGPQMAAAIVNESKAVADLHKHYSYDFILSDNRFGCRVHGLPSAILTHQVHLPIQNWFSRKLGNFLNHRLIAKFDQVIVPDAASPARLAGKMSAPHPKTPTIYIGAISRFSQNDKFPLDPHHEKKGIAIVLSGPEPQRTKLEAQLLQQLEDTPFSEKIWLIRGRPHDAPMLDQSLLEKLTNQGRVVEVHDFLGTEALGNVLAKAEIIVTRPGYTTAMDLAVLQRKAIFIPTPGQPEQQWLGKSLASKGIGICIEQSKLVLAKAINELQDLKTQRRAYNMSDHALLDAWIEEVLSAKKF